MADINEVTLGTRVVLEGVEQATASLSQYGATGDKAEASLNRVAAASGQLSKAQQDVARMAREVADAQRIQTQAADAGASAQRAAALTARDAAVAYVETLKRSFAEEQARIREGIARGFLTTAEARQAGRDAAAAYNQGVISAIDKASAAGAFKTGALPSVSGTAVYTELAGSLKTVEAQAVRTGVNVNTLRAGFTSLLSSALQTAPGVAQLGSTIGALAIGTATTVGVLAGVAAISLGWKVLTQDARDAKEQQEKLTTALGQWYDKQRQGATGEFEAQIAAEIRLLGQLRTALENTANRKLTSDIPEFLRDLFKSFAIVSFDPRDAAAKFESLWNQYVARQKAAIAKGGAEVKAAARQAYEDLITASYDLATKQGSNLSTLIGARANTPQQSQDASALYQKESAALKALQHDYAGLTDARAKAFNLDLQTRALATLKGIEDAAHTARIAQLKETENQIAVLVAATNAYTEANKKALESIERNGDEIRKGAATNADLLRQSEQSAELARSEGTARDYLSNAFKAENAAIEANRTLTGIALRERLETIEAIRRQGNETIRLTTLTQQVADANKLAAKNQAATGQELAEGLKATLGPLQELERGLERDLSRAIINGFKQGFGSLKGLFDSASSLFQDFAGRALSKKITDSLFTKLDANGKEINTGTFSVADQKTLGQFAIAAVAVQGVANALNSLTGAAATSAEALNNQIVSFLEFEKGIAAYSLSVNGSSIAQQLAQNKAQADALRDKANEALPGKRLQGERENQLGIISATEAAKAAQIAKDFWAGITAGLNETKGALGAYANSLTAVTKEYNDALANAYALSATTEQTAQITELYKHKLDDLTKSYNEAQHQLTLTLDAREAYAKGLSAEGDAISRRASEEKELFDAEQAGWSADQIARLKNIQGLEDEKRAQDEAAAAAKAMADAALVAAKALADARQTLAEAIAQGPTGTLESQQAAALQPLLDKQAADLTAYNAVYATYLNDISTGADATKTATDFLALYTAGVTLSGDAAAIAAQQFQNAVAKINQGTSQIQQELSLGLIDKGTARNLEAQNFGFAGLTNQQILGLFTQYDPNNPLTNAQAETNKNIITFLQDFPDAVAGAVNNTATIAAASGETTAVANAARVLTESTGNRMADYLASILIVEREQLTFWKGQSSFDRIDTGSLARWTSDGSRAPSSPATRATQSSQRAVIQVNGPLATIIVSQRDGEDSDAFIDRIVKEAVPRINEELANLAAQDRQRAGNPIVPGA